MQAAEQVYRELVSSLAEYGANSMRPLTIPMRLSDIATVENLRGICSCRRLRCSILTSRFPSIYSRR
jgi:hypothetical protein